MVEEIVVGIEKLTLLTFLEFEPEAEVLQLFEKYPKIGLICRFISSKASLSDSINSKSPVKSDSIESIFPDNFNSPSFSFDDQINFTLQENAFTFRVDEKFILDLFEVIGEFYQFTG